MSVSAWAQGFGWLGKRKIPQEHCRHMHRRHGPGSFLGLALRVLGSLLFSSLDFMGRLDLYIWRAAISAARKQEEMPSPQTCSSSFVHRKKACGTYRLPVRTIWSGQRGIACAASFLKTKIKTFQSFWFPCEGAVAFWCVLVCFDDWSEL